MKDLIVTIAKMLVDKPDLVVATEIKGEHTSVIELKVDREDVGKVIGKQGRTAQALRGILMAASTKIKKRCILEILD
ncbi:MAG: KH domain-containing protein [Deltaproteobacteria bacterium]|nr:KH domain-containing protein [Deltaproteobacteria bacterium]